MNQVSPLGQSLEDFLKEKGILEEVNERAMKATRKKKRKVIYDKTRNG